MADEKTSQWSKVRAGVRRGLRIATFALVLYGNYQLAQIPRTPVSEPAPCVLTTGDAFEREMKGLNRHQDRIESGYRKGELSAEAAMREAEALWRRIGALQYETLELRQHKEILQTEMKLAEAYARWRERTKDPLLTDGERRKLFEDFWELVGQWITVTQQASSQGRASGAAAGAPSEVGLREKAVSRSDEESSRRPS